ncbi:MAG: hypothetical protein ACOCXQ_02190 [Patescibacteria group bacterium]
MYTLLAQVNQETIQENFAPARYFNSVSAVVNTLVSVIMFLAAITFLVMLFLAGYKILTAAGNADAVTDARNIATFAILGLIFITISYLIVRIISYVLGVDLLF